MNTFTNEDYFSAIKKAAQNQQLDVEDFEILFDCWKQTVGNHARIMYRWKAAPIKETHETANFDIYINFSDNDSKEETAKKSVWLHAYEKVACEGQPHSAAANYIRQCASYFLFNQRNKGNISHAIRERLKEALKNGKFPHRIEAVRKKKNIIIGPADAKVNFAVNISELCTSIPPFKATGEAKDILQLVPTEGELINFLRTFLEGFPNAAYSIEQVETIIFSVFELQSEPSIINLEDLSQLKPLDDKAEDGNTSAQNAENNKLKSADSITADIAPELEELRLNIEKRLIEKDKDILLEPAPEGNQKPTNGQIFLEFYLYIKYKVVEKHYGNVWYDRYVLKLYQHYKGFPSATVNDRISNIIKPIIRYRLENCTYKEKAAVLSAFKIKYSHRKPEFVIDPLLDQSRDN